MIDRPAITQTKAQRAAVIRVQVPRSEIESAMDSAIGELLTTLEEQGQAPAGPMFAHHLSLSDTRFDFEVGFPIDSPIEPAGRVVNGALPAATAARTTHRGPYEELYEAWRAFGEVLEREALLDRAGLERGDTLWEVYAVGPETTPDSTKWCTELYLPLFER